MVYPELIPVHIRNSIHRLSVRVKHLLYGKKAAEGLKEAFVNGLITYKNPVTGEALETSFNQTVNKFFSLFHEYTEPLGILLEDSRTDWNNILAEVKRMLPLSPHSGRPMTQIKTTIQSDMVIIEKIVVTDIISPASLVSAPNPSAIAKVETAVGLPARSTRTAVISFE